MSALILEHESLLETATTLTAVLRDFDNRLLPSEVDHQQHRDFARRARSLSLQFEAIVQMIRLDLYPPAFSVIRTAMEHELVDELMMLGNLYKQVFGSVTDEQWESLLASYDERRPEASTIVERPTRNSRGRVTIVRRGLFEEGAAVTDATISALYFAMQQYSPFIGSPSDQGRFDDPFSTNERRRQWAAESREIWRTYLK